jgi:transcriptional regulator with XRE-family HTH domain
MWVSEHGLEDPLQIAARTPGNRRFGDLLKALRERSGMTPTQLAEQAGVNPSFVRGIERGAQAPSMDTARALLACLREQDRIRWLATGLADLIIRDPLTEHDVAFSFTAKRKGQNHRTDGGPAMAALRLAHTMRELGPEASARLADPETGALAGAARLVGTINALIPQMFGADVDAGGNRDPAAATGPRPGEQASVPGQRDDTRFGRIVRRLAGADEQTLARVERLLDFHQFLREDREQLQPPPG